MILLATQTLRAAIPAPRQLPTHHASAAHHQLVRPHTRTRAARRLTPQTGAAHPAAPLPPVPAQPKPPDWPADNPPRPASVVWNSYGLQIEADNSSLKQTLNDVSAATGVRVQGLSADERIFGSYGPGQVRDVLSQLLDGSGYNVMMIGGQDRATPLRIVLSVPPKGNASPAPNNPVRNQDESSEDLEPTQPIEPRPQPLIGNGPEPGAPPRTPQEIMQEMQQRQQEIEQQQEEMRAREAQPN